MTIDHSYGLQHVPTGAAAQPPLAVTGPVAARGSRCYRDGAQATLEQSLFVSGAEYDFFQAVWLLERVYNDRKRVGEIGEPGKLAAVRFAAHADSMSFAASAVHEIRPATTLEPEARMIVGFMGLTGPAGVLPQSYTELVRRVEFEARGGQKRALRDWFDLFNDRAIALFYRSWKKYRPFASFCEDLSADSRSLNASGFTCLLQSFAGLGMPELSRRIARFGPPSPSPPVPASPSIPSTQSAEIERPLPGSAEYQPARLALLRYSSLLAQRPRNRSNLQALLEDFFQLSIQVREFAGNWLLIDVDAQTQLGLSQGNSLLGRNAVVGDRTWERQNKICVRIGPLCRDQFCRLLPDWASTHAHNDFDLLTQLVRLFVGPEIDVDIQLSIPSPELPECQLLEDASRGLRLGWNAWLPGEQPEPVAGDAVFCNVA